MRTIKAALLVAATVLAIAPAIAQPDSPNDNWRHGGREGRTVDSGQRESRPAPQPAPQAAPQPRQHVAAPQPAAGAPPRDNWERGNGERGNRGGQPGDQRAQWTANRGQWNRGNAQPTTPAAQPGKMEQRDRGQWSPRDGGRQDRNDGRQQRGGLDGGQRDYGTAQGNRDNRNGQWDRANRDSDHRRDGNGTYRGGSRQWNGNSYSDGRPRPNTNWRSDHRYDWRGWRNTHRDIFHRGRYSAPHGYGYRSVYRGFYLEPFFYASNYWLADPYQYRLPPVEWPYRWVRYYDDALLVDTNNGEVVDVIQSFFY